MAPVQATQHRSPREQLLSALERETATTQKVLKAYPQDQSELRPHPRAKSARELAWMFTLEQKLGALAIRDQLDLASGFPPAPEDMAQVVAAFDAGREEVLATLRDARDEDLAGTVRFPTGPGQVGDVPKIDFLWFILHDQIHHRGQFSVYLRMSGGKVPSIYGPTADEPWF